jgi:hypothetical protein
MNNRPPVINIDVPKQPRPVINIDVPKALPAPINVIMPQQEPPIVNVEVCKPSEWVFEVTQRDKMGRIEIVVATPKM